MRSAMRFFVTPSTRQYTTGSSEHLRLQAELSKLLEAYREAKEILVSIPLVEADLVAHQERYKVLIDYIEPRKQIEYQKLITQATESLKKLQQLQEENENKRDNISQRMLKILDEIKSECADAAPIAAVPPRLF